MKQTKKKSPPPIGLMPMHLWIEQRNKERIKQIKDAVIRYLDYEKVIPNEWIEEHRFLIKEADK